MAAQSARLPALRQELRLLPGPGDSAGGCDWLLYDPVRHRYFQIPRAACDLLERWRAEPPADFARRATQELGTAVSADDVAELAKFIIANNLALDPPNGDARLLATQQSRLHQSLFWRVLHGYLFFRLPLLRPDAFLRATLPLVAPLFTRTAALLVLVITLAGLYLVSRQWEAFVRTFLDFLSLEGIAVYGLSLVVVKGLHELGHAYTATRAGVRVNTMGVAFIVAMPILYTDVTDAWRLQRSRSKLAIDGAGIVVELAIAGLATFLWAFLTDGPARSAAFVLATSSWIMSLLVNLNPLMRFDGYYIVSDAWRTPNLQSRSNALAQWWLRETLFGLGRPAPESLAPPKRRLMILYALAVWVYRLFLFLGIALLVYHMFFKVLGVVLFAVEIIWFILLPITREIRMWWNMRRSIITTTRSALTALVAVGLVALFVVPWRSTVAVQGVARIEQESEIFAPRPARIVSVAVSEGAPIVRGGALVVLRAPDIEHDLAQTRRQIALAELRLDRIAGDDADLSDRLVLASELARHQAQLAGLEAELARLTVRAPLDGIARDVDVDLHRGQWIDETTRIARIVGTGPAEVEAYISEDDIWRFATGAEATFIPEDPTMERRTGRIVEIVATGAKRIELPYLASVYGGAIASDHSPDGEIRPRAGLHLVRVRLDGQGVTRAIRGTVHLTAAQESLAAVVWRRVLQVLVRESGA